MRLIAAGIQTDGEMREAVKIGVAAVGFYVGQNRPGINFILPSTAGRLAESLPPLVFPLLITQFESVDDIVDIVTRTGITGVQFRGLKAEEVAELRERLPGNAKLIPEISNDDFMPGFIMAHAGEYIAAADAFALKITNPERIGELPEIIASLPLPVIVSGITAEQAEAAGAFACCFDFSAGAE